MYWRNEGQFASASAELSKAASSKQGWDSYDAEAPSPASVATANRVLALLRRSSTAPTRIVPSAEGGIGICFVEGDSYADIEILNSDEILATTYRGQSEPRIWELQTRDDSITAAIEQIRAHLAA